MADHYDKLETRDPERRERDLLARLPGLVMAAMSAPGWAKHLQHVDAELVVSRAALAALPVMRKSELPTMQKADPPFAGLLPESLGAYGRLFTSPGPIYEPERAAADPWRTARALFAAGIRKGDVVLNTFAYHLTPGGFMFDTGARTLGCAVIPAGPGNTEVQLEAIADLKPVAYAGTPDFLKILLDAAKAAGKDAFSIRKASVGGAAFPPSLQAEIKERGVTAYQTYATADLGVVAYETPAREGLVVNEDVLLEIVRPGSGEPVADGEVGEVVVTSFDAHHPWIRLALGDLSAILAGPSPCGRTNTRIKGWMGRADQTTKVKGMFVRPEQVAQVIKRHPEIKRARLVVTREGEQDAMALKAEVAKPDAALADKIAGTLRDVTKLGGKVELVAPGALPNDGKVIADERKI
jgi:phenylacetate-CoA ligase